MVEVIEPEKVEGYTEQNTAPILENKQNIPTFLVQAKEYIKEHPESIKEVAGDEIQGLRKWIDSQNPLVATLIKSQIPPQWQSLLGLNGNSSISSQDRSGRENTKLFDPGEESGQNRSNGISKDIWAEVIEYMAEMDDEGLSPGKISDIVYDDYGIDLTHQQVYKHIERYRRSLKAEQKEEKIEQELYQKSTDKLKFLIDKIEELRKANTELEKAVAIHDALQSVQSNGANTSQESHIGLIRRLCRFLY